MPSLPSTIACYRVAKDAAGHVRGELSSVPSAELPPGDVVIRVAYSSLNYKDALAATGHPGVVKHFPHVPGIDAAGTVLCSDAPDFAAGDEVLVTGFDLGAARWGGYAELARVPAEWVVPLPAGLTLRRSMILGTAGFTAAMSVAALAERGIVPDAGEVVVTGASGGVGSLAVAILAKLRYRVVAVSDKPEARELLARLGAAEIVPRAAVDDRGGKPLLPARWAGAVDTVGGNVLGTAVRTLRPGGCATACGMLAGVELPITVYPLILRGVSLVGIDSAHCPMPRRRELWARLAGDWQPPDLDALAREIAWNGLDEAVATMLAGGALGRTVVRAACE